MSGAGRAIRHEPQRFVDRQNNSPPGLVVTISPEPSIPMSGKAEAARSRSMSSMPVVEVVDEKEPPRRSDILRDGFVDVGVEEEASGWE